MRLTQLRIHDFRCLKAVEFEPAAGLNSIGGGNGSGKTSLLEALYFLSRADSFRSGRRERLIRDGAEALTVFARLASASGQQTAGIEHRAESTRQHVDGREVAVSELVRTLPVLFVDPALHELLEEGPAYRRRFLDWGVFHVEHSFFDHWRRYRRALQQRNHALRSGLDDRAVAAWEPELAQTGEALDQLREAQIERLRPHLGAELPQGLQSVTVSYLRGWSQESSLAEALAESRGRDREAGHTQRGPHRADLRVRVDDQAVPERASRGEQKIITLALHLAQARTLIAAAKPPVLLVDDLAAELGPDYRNWLCERLQASGLQGFLTFLDPAQAPPESRMFHVEHGVLGQVERVV